MNRDPLRRALRAAGIAGATLALYATTAALQVDDAAASSSASRTLSDYWRMELLVVDGQSITVRKIVIGTALLVAGYFASRLLSRAISRALKAKVSGSGAALIETLAFYLLLLLFSISALGIAGVPLTAFTLFGGAAALGIGFGSQNVVSNFISGMILLIERPIRVGNLVQIGDLHGTVERIGARSTLVRTGSNVEIIVPNSTFLEENVINWTLTNPEVRVQVNVGVAYGSPVTRVLELLREVAQEDESVLRSPDPIVLFADFGASSLDFEVHFWIRMQTVMDRRRVESRIREAIDAAFRSEGIVIAFPQRDVHVDAVGPLDARVVADR